MGFSTNAPILGNTDNAMKLSIVYNNKYAKRSLPNEEKWEEVSNKHLADMFDIICGPPMYEETGKLYTRTHTQNTHTFTCIYKTKKMITCYLFMLYMVKIW